MDAQECIRCVANGDTYPGVAVDEDGLCGHCHWVVKAEAVEGQYQIEEYLNNWARFDDWCVRHGRTAK